MPGIIGHDRKFAERIRTAGVLQDVNGHQLDLRAGAILVMCSDGDQAVDVFQHQTGLHTPQRGTARPHVLALNGGGLLLPEGSPVAHYGEGAMLVAHILGARALKGITTVVLYVHAPCGMALAAGLYFEQVLELLMTAKLRVKVMGGDGVKVACFVHVDWGEDRKRTYFVSQAAWEAWRAQRSAASETTGDIPAMPA